MPKRIENLQENILESARTLLLSQGYEALTMRAVAARCGIAVGTLYNYYASKELLAGSVMLEDWRAALAAMEHACTAAAHLRGGMRALYEGVQTFSARYRGVWESYTFRAGQQSAFLERHRLLVRQMAGCLAPLLTRLGGQPPQEFEVFLAENVLNCANGSPLSLAALTEIAERILPEHGTALPESAAPATESAAARGESAAPASAKAPAPVPAKTVAPACAETAATAPAKASAPVSDETSAPSVP